MNNTNLNKARANKFDEFYTTYEDIHKEMASYVAYNPNVFRDKTILCPCDNPEKSNFTKYFLDHFEELGLRKLISSCISPNMHLSSPLFNGNAHGLFLIKEQGKTPHIGSLRSNGDFLSQEVTSFRNQADIIITNPPFSLFRRFFRWIRNKQFSIILPQTVVPHKYMLAQLKTNSVHISTNIPKAFILPNNAPHSKYAYTIDNKTYVKLGNVLWFTNIESNSIPQPLKLNTMTYNIQNSKHKILRKKGYQHYDNYNAIDIPFSDSIPSDYNGFMCVPISFLTRCNLNQFEIIDAPKNILLNNKEPFQRILIRNKHHEK